MLALTLLSRPQVLHARPAFRGGSLEQLAMRILRASHEPLKPDLSGAARACIKARSPWYPMERVPPWREHTAD